MGYFANGTEGDMYEEKYCEKCVHHKPNTFEGCPIWGAHFAFNDVKKGSIGETILNMLIPQDKNGANKQCNMFVSDKSANLRHKEV